MIARTFIGKDIDGCINYVILKVQAELIYSNDIRRERPEFMIRDFKLQQLLSSRIEKPVAHIALSFHNNDIELLTNEKMTEIAKDYLTHLKASDTQLLIVRHYDADHPHCHVVYNRVKKNGTVISNKMQFLNSMAACRNLTQKHGLTFHGGKSLVNRATLHGIDKKKYEIYDQLRLCSHHCEGWGQFIRELETKDIHLRFKYGANPAEILGVSFKIKGFAFKRYDIDPSISYPKLNKRFSINSRLAKAINLGTTSDERYELLLKHFLEKDRLDELYGKTLKKSQNLLPEKKISLSTFTSRVNSNPRKRGKRI